ALADRLQEVPANLSVDDVAHFHGEPLTRAGEQFLPCRFPPHEILRVHLVARAEFLPGGKAVGIVSPHLERPARGDELVGGDVPVPVSRLARGHGALVARLGFAQGFFSALAFRDVPNRAGPANDGAGRVALCHTAQLHPACLAVPDDAGFDVAACPLAGHVFVNGQIYLRAVRGMEGHPGDQVFTTGETRARREAMDLQKPRRRIDGVAGDYPVPETVVACAHGARVPFLVAPHAFTSGVPLTYGLSLFPTRRKPAK